MTAKRTLGPKARTGGKDQTTTSPIHRYHDPSGRRRDPVYLCEDCASKANPRPEQKEPAPADARCVDCERRLEKTDEQVAAAIGENLVGRRFTKDGVEYEVSMAFRGGPQGNEWKCRKVGGERHDSIRVKESELRRLLGLEEAGRWLDLPGIR